MNDDRPDTPQDDEGLDPRLSQMALVDPSTGRWLEIPEDPEADRLLDAYRTGALEADERRLVETRLRREPVLRRRLARRAGLAPELPEGIRERVLDTISKKHGISGGSHGTRWLAAAALLLLGVATVLLLPARRLPPVPTQWSGPARQNDNAHRSRSHRARAAMHRAGRRSACRRARRACGRRVRAARAAATSVPCARRAAPAGRP